MKMKKYGSVMLAAALSVAAIAGMVCPQPVIQADAAKTVYTNSNYTNVASYNSGLLIEPTLALEPADKTELMAAPISKPKPASVIITPDEEMRVTVGTTAMALGAFYDAYIKDKLIPVVRLDKTTVDPFLTWLKNTYAISDMMAVSDDISVIEQLYADDAGYLVNTVYDLTGTQLTAGRYDEWPHIAEANKAGCNILMYDGSDQNLPVAAEYVEAMTKVCWAYTENAEEAVSAIAAGCYGVVSGSCAELGEAVSYFSESGLARAQYVAAHRGITKYANEQSLTGIMASHNEGATHVEIDIQITKDGRLVSCHNTDINAVTGFPNRYIINETLSNLQTFKLNNYSERYNETFATLEDICEVLQKTDVILIVELKLDGGSRKAVEELKAIETLKTVMDQYPGMKGHWITISFYAPYAQDMRRILPEIPCCYLGGAQSSLEAENGEKGWGYAGGHVSLSKVGDKINFLRKCGIGLDEMEFDNGKGTLSGSTNGYAKDYLARGYTMNTWTYESCLHFTIRTNIATTNAAENCAMLVKEISAPASITREDIAAGTVETACTTYNGWKLQKECKLIVVSEEEGSAKVLLYLQQTTDEDEPVTFGLYSNLFTVTVA